MNMGGPAMSPLLSSRLSSLRPSSSLTARIAGTAIALLSSVAVATSARAADPTILTGTVASATGDKMGGITVSAKAVGATITTTVFTDEAGAYYFPKLPPGKYRVWAQALGFETANGEAELTT